MPYRRLPNTDIARIRALKQAIEKTSNTDFQELAVSLAVIERARNAVSKFEKLRNQYQQTLDIQVTANKTFQKKAKSARMYISHFIQVLYMSVMRAEIKQDSLEMYGLQDMDFIVPDLSSNEQILEWGSKIINGENTRISKGGVPISNPRVTKVNVMYSIFKESYLAQQNHKNSTDKTLNEISEYRKEVDEIILQIWNEVEDYNSMHPLIQRLEYNKEYGVVYYYRKGEKVQ